LSPRGGVGRRECRPSGWKRPRRAFARKRRQARQTVAHGVSRGSRRGRIPSPGGAADGLVCIGFFRPAGAWRFLHVHPRLTPWAILLSLLRSSADCSLPDSVASVRSCEFCFGFLPVRSAVRRPAARSERRALPCQPQSPNSFFNFSRAFCSAESGPAAPCHSRRMNSKYSQKFAVILPATGSARRSRHSCATFLS
jgi:hypothetical protein